MDLDNPMPRKYEEIRLPDLTPRSTHAAIAVAIGLANFGYVGPVLPEAAGVARQFRLGRIFETTSPGIQFPGLPETEINELRQWLLDILRERNIAPKVRQDIATRLKESVEVLTPQLVFKDGELRIDGALKFLGLRGLVAFAVMSLVSKGAERLSKRLGRCKRCGIFFFDQKAGNSGRPRSFCSDAHKNQVTQWRYRHKKNWEIPPLPVVGDSNTGMRSVTQLAAMLGRHQKTRRSFNRLIDSLVKNLDDKPAAAIRAIFEEHYPSGRKAKERKI